METSKVLDNNPGMPAGSFEQFSYDEKIVRMFVWATMIWGIVGMLVGAIIALQLPFWQANLGEYLSFGRAKAPTH